MKNLFPILTFLFCIVGCKQEISIPVDYNITLDNSNTYTAGDPVRFNLGNAIVDNVIFYSGETGYQYRFKDRFNVPMEQVKTAKIKIDYQARYGVANALDVYVSKTFNGISGEDAIADRALATALSNEAKGNNDRSITGWTKLDYKEGASTVWTSQEYDLSAYLDGFCIAFHWNTPTNQQTQRTYWINAEINVELEGAEPSVISLADLDLKTVMVNQEIDDPYMKNAGNGSIRFDNSAATIVCQGIAADAIPYAIDGWIFSTPRQLNKVANDKGCVIKTLQNYMDSYEYVYKNPGYYTATFVGINANYLYTDKSVREISFLITEKP